MDKNEGRRGLGIRGEGERGGERGIYNKNASKLACSCDGRV